MNKDRDDLHDSADELKHRAAAAGEKVKRAVVPGMSAGDKIASHVKEAGHNMAAGVDRAKRDARDAATGDDLEDTSVENERGI